MVKHPEVNRDLQNMMDFMSDFLFHLLMPMKILWACMHV